MSWKDISGVMATLLLVGAASSAGANPSTPTCSDVEFLEIDVHGQHVIRDYVAGAGGVASDWPPSGRDLGDTVGSRGGVAVRGGPGPGFHFPNDVAPGASFCTNSESPGFHVGD
ncbi:MAG: hypothetical protein ACR2JJ_04900 [Sphingomicrobium sp.]